MEQVKDKVKDAGEWLVKWGYIIRGWLYIAIGWLAIKWGLGIGSMTPGRTEAIDHLAEGNFGKALLVLVVVGLVSYSGWNLLRAWRNNKWSNRLGYLISSAGYLSLVWPAVNLLTSGQAISDKGWGVIVRGVVTPFGRILAIMAGIGVIIGGLMQIKLARQLNWLGRIGFLARAIIVVAGGLFLLWAGIKIDPSQPAAFDQIILAIGKLQFGREAIIFIGGGLIILGVYSINQVRHLKPKTKYEQTK